MIKLLKYRWQSTILYKAESIIRRMNKKKSEARGYNFLTIHITTNTGETIDKKIMYVVEHLN